MLIPRHRPDNVFHAVRWAGWTFRNDVWSPIHADCDRLVAITRNPFERVEERLVGSSIT
jgi:hypothetical protein